MASSPRRVGADSSKTRDVLLDCVEKMMLEKGYASVSYRAVASRAGVTPSLVQYYFPTLDDLFLGAINRYVDRNLALLEGALKKRSDAPLHALWEYGWYESTATLMTEFMALGNHRESIRAEIAEVTERARNVQLDVLAAKFGRDGRPDGKLSIGAMLLLITGLPKFLTLEKGIGVKADHAELIEAFERYLDSIEPDAEPTKRKSRPSNRS